MAKCKICNHEKREEIEQLIRMGMSLRKIAEPFEFSYKTVERHKKECMKDQEPPEEPPRIVVPPPPPEEPKADAQVIEGTGEGSEGDEPGAITVHIENQEAAISAKRIVDAMDEIIEDAKSIGAAALSDGEYGAAIETLKVRMASQGLIVNMAKIAAFGSELPKDDHRTAADRSEDDDEDPPWLEGLMDD